MNLSITEFKAKRYRDAARDAEAALNLQPDSSTAKLFLGASYAELEEYNRALPAIEQVIAAQPRNRDARMIMAESLLALGRYEEAAVQFQIASNLARESPKVWFGLGRTVEELSGRLFQKLERIAPDSAYWLSLAGDASLTQRRYGTAFAYYRRALASPGVLRGLHASLAAIYKQTGHAGWALVEEAAERELPPPNCVTAKLACDYAAERYREIVESSGEGAEFCYWASKAYTALAHQAYDHLTRLPSSPERHMHDAREHGSQGLDLQAVAEWREALKLAPDNFEIQVGLVRSLYRSQDFDAALPLLYAMTESRPDSSELNFLCGASLVNLEKFEKAIPYLERAVRLDPQFVPAHAALGHALLLAGEAPKAVAHLKAALSSDQDGSTHFQLFRAYQVTGQTGMAKQAFAEYQQARTSSEMRQRAEEGGIAPP